MKGSLLLACIKANQMFDNLTNKIIRYRSLGGSNA